MRIIACSVLCLWHYRCSEQRSMCLCLGRRRQRAGHCTPLRSGVWRAAEVACAMHGLKDLRVALQCGALQGGRRDICGSKGIESAQWDFVPVPYK